MQAPGSYPRIVLPAFSSTAELTDPCDLHEPRGQQALRKSRYGYLRIQIADIVAQSRDGI